VTERLRLAVYLVDWQWSDALGEKRVKYAHAGVEAVHCLSNPITDIVGTVVYGEVKVGDWVMAWQGKGPSLKEFRTVVGWHTMRRRRRCGRDRRLGN
jgi:hypothetical protein